MSKTFTITFPDHFKSGSDQSARQARLRMSEHLRALADHLCYWPENSDAAILIGVIAAQMKQGPVSIIKGLKAYAAYKNSPLPKAMLQMIRGVIASSVYSCLESDRQLEEIEAASRKLERLQESGWVEGAELPDLNFLPVSDRAN